MTNANRCDKWQLNAQAWGFRIIVPSMVIQQEDQSQNKNVLVTKDNGLLSKIIISSFW